MHLDSTRAKNAGNWYRYAQDFQRNGDHYGAFFAGWISLVILARDVMANKPRAGTAPEGDRVPVENLFRSDAKWSILGAVRVSHLGEYRRVISARRGGEILATARNKTALSELSNVWRNHERNNNVELKGLQELLLEARNGLFHGSKRYSDSENDRESDDRQLLEALNPILFAVLMAVFDWCNYPVGRLST
jgi:hypothetical protein